MKIMSCKKCLKNAKNGNINKNDLNINKTLCIHLPKYYISAPEIDTFALFKVFSSQRGLLGVNLIKKVFFLINFFKTKQNLFNKWLFFLLMCISLQKKKNVMPDLFLSYSDHISDRLYIINEKSYLFGFQQF